MHRPSFLEGSVPGSASQPVWRTLPLPGVEVRPHGRPARNVISIADLAISAIFRRVRRIAKNDHVLRPVRVESVGSHWTDLNEILYLRIKKSVEKIEI